MKYLNLHFPTYRCSKNVDLSILQIVSVWSPQVFSKSTGMEKWKQKHKFSNIRNRYKRLHHNEDKRCCFYTQRHVHVHTHTHTQPNTYLLKPNLKSSREDNSPTVVGIVPPTRFCPSKWVQRKKGMCRIRQFSFLYITLWLGGVCIPFSPAFSVAIVINVIFISFSR